MKIISQKKINIRVAGHIYVILFGFVKFCVSSDYRQ